jgi:hypothetical protein
MTGPVPIPSADSVGVVRDVTAWPTGVPGLVVAATPEYAAAVLVCLGSWSVVHARSGRRLPYCLPDPEAALGLALAARDVTDWQQPIEAVRPAFKTGAYLYAVAPYQSWRCRHESGPTAPVRDNGVIA